MRRGHFLQLAFTPPRPNFVFVFVDDLRFDELAGLPAPPSPLRVATLIKYISDNLFPRVHKMGYRAIRTERWKYIQYVDLAGADELYDLRTDPFELHNRINEPQAPKKALQQRLAKQLPAL